MPLEIIPFTEDDLEPAAELAAARYAAERAANPLLPERFEDAEEIYPRLQSIAEHVPGVTAIHEGRLAGYLLGLLISNRGERWAYVPDIAHAAVDAAGAPGAGPYRTYRALYGALAATWLRWGCFAHAITFYPHEQEAMDAWFSLGFGIVVIDALRDMQSPTGGAAGLQIREATTDDLNDLATLNMGLWRHLSSSPTLIPLLFADRRHEDAGWLAEKDHVIWVAYEGQCPAGFVKFEPSEALILPTAGERTIACTGAYVDPAFRSSGVATALLAKALDWARAHGYQRASVDFESANILGSAFWLHSGYRPVAYSCLRRVDSRVAWANPSRPDDDLLAAYDGHIRIG